MIRFAQSAHKEDKGMRPHGSKTHTCKIVCVYFTIFLQITHKIQRCVHINRIIFALFVVCSTQALKADPPVALSTYYCRVRRVCLFACLPDHAVPHVAHHRHAQGQPGRGVHHHANARYVPPSGAQRHAFAAR